MRRQPGMPELPHAAASPLALLAAGKVVPAVQGLLRPKTAIDVGCGTGAFTAALLAADVDAFGADSRQVGARLMFPRDRFYEADLTDTFSLPRRFDLVLSLEVAEHLPATSADGFVRILVDLGDLVVFSAASPHQTGPGHVNLQWPPYWAALFAGYGYACADPLRPILWNDADIPWYYRQNILVFAPPDKLEAFGLAATAPLALVHPDHLAAANMSSGRQALRDLTTLAVRRLLKLLPDSMS